MTLAVGVLVVLSGCGQTTGATDIKRQPDGTYSAKLNVVGSCKKASPTTPCTFYTQWRKVGTDTWTKGPTVTISKKVIDKHTSQTATGLANNTTYEYQLCGQEAAAKNVLCGGPSQNESTDEFVIGRGSTGGDGGGGSSAVPIGIAVAAGILILGGLWWASRRFGW